MAVAALAVLYFPINLLWMQVLPSYARIMAAIGEASSNAIEFSDTVYRFALEGGDFKVIARATVSGAQARSDSYELDGTRPADLVAYNLSLWAALALATAAFIGPKARWRYLLVAPALIILWHVCDLIIFAKNTRWMLLIKLNEQFPAYVDYSFGWHWFWHWALELNRRIIDPFLPLLLWIVFCSKSFLISHLNNKKE